MGITFNLYRNTDGSLDGRYRLGDKPITGGGTPALAWSAPQGLADGNTLTITTDGTNPFGLGCSNVKFESFQGGTLGTEGTTLNTVFDTTSESFNWPLIFGSDSRSGSLAARMYRQRNSSPFNYASSINTINFGSLQTEVFYSVAIKTPSGKYFPGVGGGNSGTNADYGNSSWKVAWLLGEGFSSGVNDLVIPTHAGSGVWNISGNDLPILQSLGTNPSWWKWGGWNRLSTFVKAGATPEVDAGNLYFQVANGQEAISEFNSNPVIFANGTGPNYGWAGINTAGWIRDSAGGSDGLGADIECLYDDMYVAWGANAAARVEIGDNAVYESCTNLAICDYSAWSGSSITAKVRDGGVSLLGPTWIHVTLSDNTTRYTVQASI